MSAECVVQSGLTTPEEITFSFNPPSSQQLWTPVQQEHAARIYLQRELAIEEALAKADFSPREYGNTSALAPIDSDLPCEVDISPAPHGSVTPELPIILEDPLPSKAPVRPPFPSDFEDYLSQYAAANANSRKEFGEYPSTCSATANAGLNRSKFDDYPSTCAAPNASLQSSKFNGYPSTCAAINASLPSEFDISPPLDAQPPTPVVLKSHQRAKLDKRFHARVDSPTPSEDTYQRLLQGCSFSTSTPRIPTESYSIDPASLVRPSAPEPPSFSQCDDDKQTEIDRLKNENAGLQRQLEAYKNMANSLIEQHVERSFSDRDQRRLHRRVEHLQRRLDEDDAVISEQQIQIDRITNERDNLESSLCTAYDLLKTSRKDLRHQTDRIEDLEGDLLDAHRQIYKLKDRRQAASPRSRDDK